MKKLILVLTALTFTSLATFTASACPNNSARNKQDGRVAALLGSSVQKPTQDSTQTK